MLATGALCYSVIEVNGEFQWTLITPRGHLRGFEMSRESALACLQRAIRDHVARTLGDPQ